MVTKRPVNSGKPGLFPAILDFRIFLLLCLWTGSLGAQVHTGELRVRVTDPAGGTARALVTVTSRGEGYQTATPTSDAGVVDLKALPFGLYQVTVEKEGFDPLTETLEVRSAIPVDAAVSLQVAAVRSNVRVTDAQTLLDPNRPSSVSQIGAKAIEDRVASLPGRSVQDLVNSQPGWLYEGNAVLHPRGSEYQTQFVVDGIPLTQNSSPTLGPELEADDIDAVRTYTAGFPAEYGRKLGGVVELTTRQDADDTLHGQLIAGGGTYSTAQAYARVQDTWRGNVLGATASGSMTDHFLNPVVPQNLTNHGTAGDFSARYARDLDENNRLQLSVRHELERYQIPNEYVQQAAGQLQDADSFETIGTASYQRILSPNVLVNTVGFVRNDQNDLFSNAQSTPINFVQHNFFNEGYAKATLSWHFKNQEWKAGVESDNTFLHEHFTYFITDPTQFDTGTPPTFAFTQSRPDLEQAAFAEDLLRLGKWTVSAGLRWDHYQLLLNQNAVSPRVSVGRYLPALNLVTHISYDRIFQTPSFENILAGSSPAISSLNPLVLRLPVKPSTGNYYEGGLAKGFADKMSVDVNVFRRDLRNFADDNQLLNTSVGYPISFRKAAIYGAEGKLELLHWANFNGFASYSYIVGNAWFPVTGGLFLGDAVTSAQTQLTGHFPDSQDQRNTLRTRVQYQALPRAWLATGLSYGSGLPFDFAGVPADVLAQYGQSVLNHLNFDRGRVRSNLALSASLGFDFYTSDKARVRFQVDGDNLNNRLNVIDFGGLFSGNAIAPGRSVALRLSSSF